MKHLRHRKTGAGKKAKGFFFNVVYFFSEKEG